MSTNPTMGAFACLTPKRDATVVASLRCSLSTQCGQMGPIEAPQMQGLPVKEGTNTATFLHWRAFENAQEWPAEKDGPCYYARDGREAIHVEGAGHRQPQEGFVKQ